MFDTNENIDQAANVVETSEGTIPAEETQPTSPVEPVDQTKAFATRLKEEKAKAKLEAREEIAQSFGYATWAEYAQAQTDNKLLDKGLDPDMVRSTMKDLIREDPEYIEAMRYKQEKEELEKELFATTSLKALNDKFGTNYKSIDELDKDTIDDWNKGTPLEKAFAANNYDKLIDMAVKKVGKVQDNGKSHLKNVTGSIETPKTREVSKDELAVVRSLGYSEDQFKAYLNRTNK